MLKPIATQLFIALGLTLALAAQAQNFPTKPVRIITLFPVGSGPEGVARMVADKLSRLWGQPVVVESLIEKSAINRTHPEAVMRHEQLEAAIQTAQSVIRQSAAVLGEGAPPLDMAEQIQALGGNWRGILQGPEGAMDAIAARVAPAEA